MIGGKITVFVGIISFVAGLLIGSMFGYSFLRPDINKAVVKQLAKDDKGLEKARVKTEVKYVYRDKIKTVIKTIKDDDCFVSPIPDNAASGVLDAFDVKRQPPD